MTAPCDNTELHFPEWKDVPCHKGGLTTEETISAQGGHPTIFTIFVGSALIIADKLYIANKLIGGLLEPF